MVRFATCLLGLIVALAGAGSAWGQIRIQLGDRLQVPALLPQTRPERIELTPASVEEISGTVASQLQQVEALVSEEEYDEAIRALRELIAERTTRVVDAGDGLFVSLREACHQRIARLPSEALVRYREMVDPIAEPWYREAIETRDAALLERLVDELFCSSRGDDALLALGDWALEAACYNAARRHWLAIDPQLRSPTGLPGWHALGGIDLAAHWPAVAQRWQSRSDAPDWLAYPDTEIPLADVRARLVLASIRAGQFKRAAQEVDAFRRWHPTSRGRLGGEEQVYAEALTRLLEQARSWPELPPERDWPTFAGSPTRSTRTEAAPQFASTLWSMPLELTDEQSDAGEAPLIHPVVFRERVYWNDGNRVRAVELATGLPAGDNGGTIFGSAAADVSRDMPQRFRREGQPSRRGSTTEVSPRTLTVHRNMLYARLGSGVAGPFLRPDLPSNVPGEQLLVGLDLSRDGLLTFKVAPPDSSWQFDGAPLADRRRVFVAMRRIDVKPQALVACYDAATSELLWQTPICSADTPAGGRAAESASGLLTLVDDTIYYNTNLGIVAAVAVGDGQIRWLRAYDRAEGNIKRRPRHLLRDPSPAMLHDGMLFVAPSDAPQLMALDATTGKTLWETTRSSDVVHLLGAADDRLIAAGDRCWSFDIQTGRVQFVWPESTTAGLRGIGRGQLAGGEIWWPTRREIYVLDARTGARTRTPIDLTQHGTQGANLVLAREHLLVVGQEQIAALGQSAAPPAAPIEQDAHSQPTMDRTSLSVAHQELPQP